MVFLDASKAFDRVWHAGLLYKLKQLGICESLVRWIQSYLSDRVQRVVINGHTSSWSPVHAGVPQGSILGPLLFLIYTNDIVENIVCDIYLYADDTSLLSINENPGTAAHNLNCDLQTLLKWSEKWFMSFNPTKTVSMQIYTKSKQNYTYPLIFNGVQIEEVDSHTHLGLTLSKNMSWKQHIKKVGGKANQCLGMLQHLKYSLPGDCAKHLYNATILPIFDYCDILYDNCHIADKQYLERIHLKAARIVTGAMHTTNTSRLLEAELGWETLEQRRKYHKLTLFYKVLHYQAPVHLSSHVPRKTGDVVVYGLRNPNNIQPYKCRTQLYQSSYFPSSVNLWNRLSQNLQNSISLGSFKLNYQRAFSPQVPPPYYSEGDRRLSILHTRLRLKHNSLNSNLFKVGLAESPACECGFREETESHYLLFCPIYMVQRNILLDSVSQLVDEMDVHTLVNSRPSRIVQLLLSGSGELPINLNSQIFKHTRKYIDDTARFLQYKK
jgi:hypothetical protein